MTTAAGPILDELTCRALDAFNCMLEVGLIEGQDSQHYRTVERLYQRELARLGQAIEQDLIDKRTKAVREELAHLEARKRKFRKAA